MTTSVKLAVTAMVASALVSIASAQITTPFPTTNLFADPGPPNAAQFHTDLGDLYFNSSADVPSSIQGWNPGPVDFTAALGGNPFEADGGTVNVTYLGKTAGWQNTLLYTQSDAPTDYHPLVTKIGNPATNLHSGFQTEVSYAAGTQLEFWLNSGGASNQGGLFSAFGSANLYAGSDSTSHVRWSTRDVTTTYFDGSSWVTAEVPTLLIGFEDTRKGVSFYDGDFNDLVLAFQFLPSQSVPVPESSTYGLIGAAGLLGLVGLRRFKRKAA